MTIPHREQLKLAVLGALFALSSVLAVFGLDTLGVWRPLEWITYDARLRAFNADKPAPPQIAVVMIDEASLQYLDADAGRWPWPRSVHADLLDFLALGKPRAVVFDVLFVERQRDVEHDARLVEATKQSGVVIHATQLLHEADDELTRTRHSTGLPGEFVTRFSLRSRLNADAAVGPVYNDEQLPLDGLWQAAGGVGVVRADADADGRYRRMRLLHPRGDAVLPSLALAPVLDVLAPQRIDVAPGTISFDALHVPVDRNGWMLVNQYGVFQDYSYSGLIASLKQINAGNVDDLPVDPAEFADRIVFVGASAVGVQDLKATPLGANTPGVYLQASIAGNLLTGDFLQPMSPALGIVLVVLLALCGAYGALLFRQVSLKIVVLLAVIGLYSVGAVFEFSRHVVVDLIAPLAAAFFAWFASFSYLFFTEGKDKRRVRKVLAQYVSPDVLAEVVDKYSDYMHAEIGRKEVVSVLFSDIRSFTTVSESLPAEKVVEMLNIYFSAMTDVIFAQRGTIDKFIGDAIMAFWGAPIPNEHHAQNAVRAALEMIRMLPEVNANIAARGIPPLDIGVGIHTGEAVLGNIGSEKKLAYTAIGDNVNLASRLEGLTKHYGCPILISEPTRDRVCDLVPCRLVDRVRVKGKSNSIRIYTPLPTITEEQRTAAIALCEATRAAFDLYQRRRFTEARAAYATLPEDALRALFVERCEQYLAQPPPATWDGAYTLTSK